jgi:hypothetical protein
MTGALRSRADRHDDYEWVISDAVNPDQTERALLQLCR